MTAFKRYIGIDYSGAGTPDSEQDGLQISMAKGCDKPTPQLPSGANWMRKEIATWLSDRLAEDIPTLVGIDHGFSFPRDYFDKYGLDDWSSFLDDFLDYCPTHEDGVRVQDILTDENKKRGNKDWKRRTEICARGAKSVFHFGVPGQVAPSTHAGLPWLHFIREELKKSGREVHFWPFDNWEIPGATSAIAEVYPSLWSRSFPREERNGHEQDAYAVARWLAAADRSGDLDYFLNPKFPSDVERKLAQRVEGWILGVEWDSERVAKFQNKGIKEAQGKFKAQ